MFTKRRFEECLNVDESTNLRYARRCGQCQIQDRKSLAAHEECPPLCNTVSNQYLPRPNANRIDISEADNIVSFVLSLSQLRERHETLILFDSASTRVQVGVLLSNKDEYWETADGEAGSALFPSTASLLQKAKPELADNDPFTFSQGPGSMLGIRTPPTPLQ